MTRPRTRSRLSWGLLAAAIAATLLVSTTPAVGQPAPSGPQGKILRYAIAGDENNFTPYSTTNRSGKTQDILNLIYDTLLYSPFQEKPEPWLAESAERSDDGKVWTVKLRPGLTWHDGRPLTADDVKFTYEYFHKTEQGRYSHHVNDLPFVERTELVDARTVRFTCRKPCPTFDIDPLADLPILPRHVWESVTEPAKFTKDLPIGSGPYKVVEHVPDQLYRLRANDSYFKGRPTVDEIQMPIIKESASMFLALRSGQVDAVARVVPPEGISELERSGLAIVRMPDYGSIQVNFNNQRPPFTESKFRKALTLATDTAGISRTLLADRAKPGAESFLDPDSPFAASGLRPQSDPRRAAELLDELGFKDTNGDATRETPEGRPLDFEILVSSVEAREVRASELVASQLSRVGVKVRVTALDPVTVNNRRQPANKPTRVPEATQTGDYDMYVTAYSGGHFHFDPDGLLYVFHCPGQTGFGAYIAGYCNRGFDRLVDQAAELDASARKAPLAEAQRVLFEDPPVLSLYFPDGTFAYRPQAYSDWIEEIGHGIFHKRSFLPGARAEGSNPSAPDRDEGTGRSAVPFMLVALAVVVVGAIGLAKRRRGGTPGEATGPEVE